MAVIAELIEAGQRLREQGNLQGAIEHFRQLHTTYPGNARIMFELANAWRAFEVPAQALPFYRDLLALPRGQGLPPKDMPRLYTHLGATLRSLGEFDESLAIIEEGLRLHPSYRPLRAWRIFSWYSAGSQQLALLDTLELMLESLAPSRWDVFEDDIVAVVVEMQASLDQDNTLPRLDKIGVPTEQEVEDIQVEISVTDPEPDEMIKDDDEEAAAPAQAAEAESQNKSDIAVTDDAPDDADFEISVTVMKSTQKGNKSRRKKSASTPPQFGGKAVRIDISAEGEEKEAPPEDEEPPAPSGALKIPIDLD